MKTVRLFGFLLSTFLLCIACGGGNEEEPTPTPTPTPSTPTITIDNSIITNGLSFSETQGESSITFTTDADWTLSVAETRVVNWCIPSATSGQKGNSTVKFSVTENTGYDDRSVAVTIKAGSTSKTFKITQKQKDALLVTTNKYEIEQIGGEIEVEVKANIDYQIEIAENAKSWISESNTRALKENIHHFTIATSEELEKREGEIYVKSGNKNETITIYQSGGAIIILSQKEFNVSDAGDIITVDVKSNVEYGVQMPEIDWISEDISTRGVSSHTLKYVISSNENYDSRTADIIFFDKNSDLKDTLTILQVQKDAIIISNKEFNVDSKGDIIEVIVNSNIKYEVIIQNNEWITETSQTRGLIEEKHYFEVMENETYDNRVGQIYFTNNETGVADTLIINQKEKSCIELYREKVNIGYKGEMIEIKVKSNTDVICLLEGIDWINQVSKTRSFEDNVLYFNIKENNTFDKRTANIFFTNSNKSASDTLCIIQDAKPTINLSKSEIVASAEGEIINVKVEANTEYNVEIKDADWITKTSNTQFAISENHTGFERIAEIKFVDLYSDLTVLLKVIQPELPCEKVVHVTEAGTLEQLLGDKYSEISSLKISGKLNGTDIVLLREMMTKSSGNLLRLDIADASIVEGGSYIYIGYSETYTKDNILGGRLFAYCDQIETIVLPKNIKKTEHELFHYCTNLKYVYFYDDITEMGSYTFSNCNNLLYVKLPNGIKRIEYFMFYDCSKLYKITLPNTVTHIDMQAFYKCSSLKEITLPNNIKEIAWGAFEDVTLEKIICLATTPAEITYSTFPYEFKYSTKLYVPSGCSSAYKNSLWNDRFLEIIELNYNDGNMDDTIDYGGEL